MERVNQKVGFPNFNVLEVNGYSEQVQGLELCTSETEKK